ncbi:Reverse transcriptase RNA-dependent DNA polymerase [Trinorchestia longiramus]|nr:Reverse transcriptase RNA-dependent DNA polymerase [Trinorchestia longiramus]
MNRTILEAIECVPWSFPQEEKHEDSEGELELRRSIRNRAAPDRFGEWVCFAQDKFDVPANVEEALHRPESKLWKVAMEEEMASMNINNVWSLVECPKNKKPIRCKWIFKKKTVPDGNVCSYKARLVAQGYAQKFGVDYDETFSPVVRFESVRAVLALAAKHNLQLHHMDVATAFLNGELSEEIYLTQPEVLFQKAMKILFGMDNANSVATPVDVNVDLVTTSDEVEECDKDLYQSAISTTTTTFNEQPTCNLHLRRFSGPQPQQQHVYDRAQPATHAAPHRLSLKLRRRS